MELSNIKQSSWLDRPVLKSLNINLETLLFAIIIIFGILTRFSDLEPRVILMSIIPGGFIKGMVINTRHLRTDLFFSISLRFHTFYLETTTLLLGYLLRYSVWLR